MSTVVYLNGTPAGSFPDSVLDVYAWVIRESSDVWAAALSFQGVGLDGARHYYSGGGPLWDPGILVDVVVGVRTSPSSVSLVLLRDVSIHRSD